ncbi:MAG: response regulator transcription factor [Betaproteobacteria bacterium]|nr:response regulator transcription factor [Betaproteobacteria bacterium]
MRHNIITLATHDDTLARRWQAACDDAPTLRVVSSAEISRAENIVIIDAALPDLPKLNSTAWPPLAKRLRLVFASSQPNDAEGLAAIAAGFAGYCHAYCAVEQLRQILAVVASGELWVGRSLVARLVRAVHTTQPNIAADWAQSLTEREQEVAQRVALAESNAEIATALGITERTVKSHLSGIFDKLGVADRLQLTLKVHGIR